MEAALHGSTNPSGNHSRRQQSETAGKSCPKWDRIHFWFQKKGLTHTHAITQKSPLMHPPKNERKGRPQTQAIMVLITLLVLGEKQSIYFSTIKNGVLGAFIKEVSPSVLLLKYKEKKIKMKCSKSGTPVTEKSSFQSNQPTRLRGEGVKLTHEAAPRKWPIPLTGGRRGQAAATPLY